ncbi:membrane fusion protein, cobalt-zinc-cadmium efflux system [Massilia sp. PDC64]|nr:efflux RND transporter periplasmic adaptor subunit [Massilia sp. PDC64]SDE64803.1 membrane fusion protein, cobalt-zinc-cadmium efflux system [Massilia sp. PDC64]
MKSINQNKSWKSVAAIVTVGLVLGAAILFWTKEPGQGKPAEEQEHAAAASEKAEPHGGEEGLVHLSAQQIQQAGITTATAGEATIETSVQLPGEVRFNEDRTAHIVPRLPGVAESVSANLGQTVKKGQVLAVIASPELAELRSALGAARTKEDLARVTYERERKLWQDKISAEQDYLQARQAWEEAKIATRTAQSKLTALGVTPGNGALNRYELRAPFDGVIVEKHISLGEAVKEDANVFLLSDLSRVWVDVVVTPKDLGVVRVGETATVKAAAADLSATGKVSYVGALVGEQTRSATARVELVNPSLAWRPGLFVNVSLVQGSKRAAVAVRSDALQTIEEKPVVFVKVPAGFKAHPVTVGASDTRHVEILQGLTSGATYASGGSFVLKAELGKGSAEHED